VTHSLIQLQRDHLHLIDLRNTCSSASLCVRPFGLNQVLSLPRVFSLEKFSRINSSELNRLEDSVSSILKSDA
jgi:hypothetical protein